jgi:hypothetical protein
LLEFFTFQIYPNLIYLLGVILGFLLGRISKYHRTYSPQELKQHEKIRAIFQELRIMQTKRIDVRNIQQMMIDLIS